MQVIRLRAFSMVRILPISVLIIALIVAFTSVSGFAQNQTPAKKGEPAAVPIKVSADKLVSNAEKKYAEFIGDVKATQGNSVITSDTLRIYYEGDLLNPDKNKKSSNKDSNKDSNKEMIKKIVARGNVDVVSEQYTAKTDKMEYDFDTQTLILTGENSIIASGNNSIVGSKITYYQADGRFNVEGGPDKRVNAVFFSGGNVSDIFGEGESKKGPKQ